MTTDQERLQRKRETFLLRQMRDDLQRETERLTQEIERLRKAYEDAGLPFPDDAA